MKKNETMKKEDIVCPHCESEDIDCCEIEDLGDEQTWGFICQDCDETFDVDFEITYTVLKIKKT